MGQWTYFRKILLAFIALAVFSMVIAGVSMTTLRSVIVSKDAVLEQEASQLTDAMELRLLHERRVSELRGYLLSRRNEHLVELRRSQRELEKILERLFDRVTERPAHDILTNLRSINSDYDILIRRAIREPSRSNWIVSRLIRPQRRQFETQLSELNKVLERDFASARAESDGVATASVHNLRLVLLGKMLVILGFAVLLWRAVKEEQMAAERVSRSSEILKLAEKKAGLLAQAGKVLTESNNPDEALGVVARSSVEWLANLCLIELSEMHGALGPVALAIANTERDDLIRSLHSRLPGGLGTLFGTDEAASSHNAVLRESVQDRRLTGLGISSYIAVPLRARGRSLGVLLLARTGGAAYNEADLQFTRELSHQTALAIDNARLLKQAETGLRMREELLATVAHDLRNPLTSIRMNAELLGRISPELKDERLTKRASSIAESSHQMERLIRDLLDLTKIESGRIVLDRRPYDAEELISVCLQQLAPGAAAKGIELIKEVKPGESIAYCDRDRVLQVLSNLVGNAVKFTDRNGRVRVEAQPTGEGIRFSVIDNGPGIPSEQLPHVFERYWQSRRMEGRGAGLGLSIAQGIVEAHGGRIWVESALHIGSRFFFVLPEARQARIDKRGAA